MQTSYYIFDDEGEVIAIFKNEEFARDYLYHLGVDEEYCRIGMLGESVFNFEEHDSIHYTLQDSSLKVKTHKDCKRFRQPFTDTDEGYCFLTDEQVHAHDRGCSMIEVRK